MSSDDDADASAPNRARASSAQERFLLERASSGLAGREALARFVEPPAMATRARDKAAGARSSDARDAREGADARTMEARGWGGEMRLVRARRAKNVHLVRGWRSTDGG